MIAWPFTCVIVSGFPSTSESLPSTLTVTESSSATVKLSFDATGASLTGRRRADDRCRRRDRPVRDRVGEARRAVVVRRRREHELARDQLDRAIGHRNAGPPSVMAGRSRA